MIEWLTRPLTYEFMQRGLITSTVVGVLCAVVGCYVVLRGMAFLGDALAHAILPGVAIAYLFNGSLLLGALIAAVVVALLIGVLSRQGTIKEDTAIGILFAAALSLGVLLISSIHTYAVDLTHIMFGDVLGVSNADLVVTAGLAVIVLGFIVFFYREFLVMSFDPILAATLRMQAERFRMLMLILLALTIVVSLQTVGVGFVAAMLVTPGAAAYLFTRRLSAMMIVAGVLGAVSSIVGLYLSFYLSVASGAAVVLTATVIFMVAYLFAPARGVLSRRWQARAKAA